MEREQDRTETQEETLEPDAVVAQEFGFDPNAQEFKEGKEQLRRHLLKERNPSLVKLAKKTWNEEKNGRVACSVCDFCFPDVYGTIGQGFIEAHHTKPISELAPDTLVKLEDLVPICSNCHSMLHRHRPWLTTVELRKLVLEQSKKS